MKHFNSVNAALLIMVLVMSFCIHCEAQRRWQAPSSYIGLGATLGTVQQTVYSDFKAIDGMKVLQEGGVITLNGGTSVLRVSLAGGFYYSASRVPQTTDLVLASAHLELHPLQALRRYQGALSPYLIAGISANRQRFYGFYGANEAETINYSVSQDPYVGHITTRYFTYGAGICYELRNDFQFLHLLAHATYGLPVGEGASAAMAGTDVSANVSVSVGVAFGLYH